MSSNCTDRERGGEVHEDAVHWSGRVEEKEKTIFEKGKKRKEEIQSMKSGCNEGRSVLPMSVDEMHALPQDQCSFCRMFTYH